VNYFRPITQASRVAGATNGGDFLLRPFRLMRRPKRPVDTRAKVLERGRHAAIEHSNTAQDILKSHEYDGIATCLHDRQKNFYSEVASNASPGLD